MKKLNYPYYAYAENEFSHSIKFSRHRTVLGAEKAYGDLSRHYTGSAQSDFDLTILTKDEFIKLIKELEDEGWVMDWETLTCKEK